MQRYCFLFQGLALLLILIIIRDAGALRLKKTWNSGRFFKFLAKFGIQKTNEKDLSNTEGFIYGNITTDDSFKTPVTLVVVDSEYFLEFFTNSTSALSKSCELMFKKINTIAFDPVCMPYGKEDFLRRVPCPKNKLCKDEDTPSNVLPGYQFTYRVQDFQAPRFWYISLVSCYRNYTNKNCSWVRNDEQKLNIHYDVWMVNGDPASKQMNPFEHQFSFEDHDVFECYLVFLILYIFALIVWGIGYRKQKHAITTLFTANICLEFIGLLCNFIHVLVFSRNGVGVFFFATLGNAIDSVAQCLFILFLLFIARGWTITDLEITGKGLVLSLWGVYLLSNCVLYFWTLSEVDVISNTDEWQTWPGYMTLGLRFCILVWFVVELRRTVSHTKFPDRVEFLQQFAAFFMVWFIYLPVLVFISTQISELWKHKTLLTIINAADLLAYIIMIHLLWPSRTILYLIKQDDSSPSYDLEVTGLLDDDENEVFTQQPKRNGILNGKKFAQNGRGAATESPKSFEMESLDNLLTEESSL